MCKRYNETLIGHLHDGIIFIASTRILHGIAFLCKLRLLLIKPHWDYQI